MPDCEDCGLSVTPYMVYNDVWASVGFNYGSGWYCDSCFEKRFGRTIEADDLQWTTQNKIYGTESPSLLAAKRGMMESAFRGICGEPWVFSALFADEAALKRLINDIKLLPSNGQRAQHIAHTRRLIDQLEELFDRLVREPDF